MSITNGVNGHAQDSKARKVYLFGHNLKRSYSPFLHNTIFRLLGIPYTYYRYECSDVNEILPITKQPDFGGSSVTMPNKVAILKHCDDLTDEARQVGACNTLFWRTEADGSRKLVGHNTDTFGVRDSFLKSGTQSIDARGKPALVVGGGGASRAAVYALAQQLACEPIYIVNRDAREVEAMQADMPALASKMKHITTPEEAESLPAPVYIVSAIPCFPPKTPEEIAARATLEAFLSKEEKGDLLEMCYNPHIWTDMCTIAQEKGWKIITGEVAMFWQGIEQQKVWHGVSEQDLPVDETLRRVSQQVKADSANHADPPE